MVRRCLGPPSFSDVHCAQSPAKNASGRLESEPDWWSRATQINSCSTRFDPALSPSRPLGIPVVAASTGPASGKCDLRKAKRPASLSAAGRDASQGCLSTMPQKKSIHFLALVVENLRLRKCRFGTRTRPLSAVGPKAVVVGALEEVIDARFASGPRMQALLTAMSSLPKTYGPLDHRDGLRTPSSPRAGMPPPSSSGRPWT